MHLFLPRKDKMNITINYKGEEIFEIKVKLIFLLLLINQRCVGMFAVLQLNLFLMAPCQHRHLY